MNKENLQENAYLINEKEKKLKLALRNRNTEYGLNKVYMTFMFRNQLLLTKCGIDENDFNHILFKNYFYFLNAKNELNFDKMSEKDKDNIKLFNTYISENDFENALVLYEKNFCIYELLCSLYIKNLFEDKINVSEAEENDINKKIILLQNTNLTFKREPLKKVLTQRVSNR